MHGCFHDEGGHGPIHQLLPIAEPVAAVWRERRGEEGHERTNLASGSLYAHFKLLKKPHSESPQKNT